MPQPENIPQVPQETPVEPQETPVEPQATPKFDSELVQEIVEGVNKKLEKKLYYGRKQQKVDEKQAKKLENDLEKEEKSSLGFLIGTGMLITASCLMCYFGFKQLKKEISDENNG